MRQETAWSGYRSWLSWLKETCGNTTKLTSVPCVQKAELRLKGRGRFLLRQIPAQTQGEPSNSQSRSQGKWTTSQSNIGWLYLSLQGLASGPFVVWDWLISVPPGPPADLAKSGSTNLFHFGEKRSAPAKVCKGSGASSGPRAEGPSLPLVSILVSPVLLQGTQAGWPLTLCDLITPWSTQWWTQTFKCQGQDHGKARSLRWTCTGCYILNG